MSKQFKLIIGGVYNVTYNSAIFPAELMSISQTGSVVVSDCRCNEHTVHMSFLSELSEEAVNNFAAARMQHVQKVAMKELQTREAIGVKKEPIAKKQDRRRTHIATLAMQGMLSTLDSADAQVPWSLLVEDIAERAVNAADALLIRLEKKL